MEIICQGQILYFAKFNYTLLNENYMLSNNYCTLLKVNYMLHLSQDYCTLSIDMIYYTNENCELSFEYFTVLNSYYTFSSGKIIYGLLI